MKRLRCFVLVGLMALTASAAGFAQNAETDNKADAEFWFLKPGTEPTPENRIAAIQNTGKALLDFTIYQPTGTFPEDYRQKLFDAGFVFDIMTGEEQLAALEGHRGILVIPGDAPLTTDDIRRLKHCKFAFLGESPELPEPIPLTQAERLIFSRPGYEYMTQERIDAIRTTITKKSFADWKGDLETEWQRTRDRLAASPSFADKSDEEIDAAVQRMPAITPQPSDRIDAVMDHIGDNLVEALRLFSAWPEDFVTETGVQLLVRRELARELPDDEHATDVFYVFANTKEDAKPVDGWFRLRELRFGRWLGNVFFTDGSGHMINAQTDLAFFMDPATGRIGAAAVRHVNTGDWPNSDNGYYVRIRMQPGETLVVCVARERCKGMGGIGFAEFESLPEWEYDE
ncbi:MAG: hypothetical protein FWH27_10620 [Planctomycetaceae bacterium]|nr:hypothetical protein [Planctomycetaceae bacterium]